MSNVPVVEDFMTRKVFTLDRELDIYEAILRMIHRDVSGAPVLCRGELCGMLSEKDCMRIFAEAAFGQFPAGKVADYMVPNPETIGPKVDLFTVAGMFMHRPYRRMPVVDNGDLVGIVSRPDVLKASVELWEHPNGKSWTDSKYLTDEIKAALSR